jgi:hypothetical protein
MSVPCFVSFENFILKVTVFWDVMWSDRYVPVFQRKPCSLSFTLKNMSIIYTALHGIIPEDGYFRTLCCVQFLRFSL